MPLANYTTGVPTSRSIALIQSMLAAAGAESIMVDYEAREPSAITFRVARKDLQFGFRLPADWRRTLAVITPNREIAGRFKTNDQAKRIAWRTVHDWLRAQLALIETGAAEIQQCFCPTR